MTNQIMKEIRELFKKAQNDKNSEYEWKLGSEVVKLLESSSGCIYISQSGRRTCYGYPVLMTYDAPQVVELWKKVG